MPGSPDPISPAPLEPAEQSEPADRSTAEQAALCRCDLFGFTAEAAAEDHRVEQAGAALFEAMIGVGEAKLGEVCSTKAGPERTRTGVQAIDIR